MNGWTGSSGWTGGGPEGWRSGSLLPQKLAQVQGPPHLPLLGPIETDGGKEFRSADLSTNFRPDFEHVRLVEVNELHALVLPQVLGKSICGFRKAFVQFAEIKDKASPAAIITLLEQPRRRERIHPVFVVERPAPIKGIRFPFGQMLQCEFQILFRDAEFVVIARCLV